MRRIYRIVFLLFICSLYLSGQAQNQSLSLEDFFVNGTFRSKGVYGLRSMNDGEHYTVLENGGKKITQYSYKTGKPVATLLDLEQIEQKSLTKAMRRPSGEKVARRWRP